MQNEIASRETYEKHDSMPARWLREKEQKIIALARTDISVFTHFVFGFPNQPFHNYMQSLVESHDRITLDCAVEHGKTVQMSVIRPTFTLGRDPHATIANVSSTPELPRRSLGVIRSAIVENENLHKVFPKLRLVENTKHSITIERKGGTTKDPSIAAMGIEGAILGRRWSLLITDDILRFASTWTPHMRDVVWKRFIGEMLGRLEARAKHIDIGTPWQIEDLRHKMRKLPGYLFLRFNAYSGDVTDIDGKIVRRFGEGLWPTLTVDPITKKEHGWPRWRLDKLRKTMPGFEFQRQIECLALNQAMQIFGKHLDRCREMGEGIEMSEEDFGGMKICFRAPDPNWKVVFSGVDLAISKQDTAADTAFYTGAVEKGVKHLLEMRKGKIEGPDIVRHMISIVRRYPLHLGFRTESNQGQAFLKQFIDTPGLLESLGATPEEAARINIIPHYTGAHNKDAAGLWLRTMVSDFERGLWVIPQMNGFSVELVQEWIDALKNYDPTGHADDMLIASWLFWEQCRGWSGNTNWDRFGIYVP